MNNNKKKNRKNANKTNKNVVKIKYICRRQLKFLQTSCDVPSCSSCRCWCDHDAQAECAAAAAAVTGHRVGAGPEATPVLVGIHRRQ